MESERQIRKIGFGLLLEETPTHLQGFPGGHYRSIIAGVNNEIPASYVDELDSFHFNGHDYAIPNRAEEFLALRYGADWRTPKKYWHPAYDDESMVKPE